MLTRRTFVRLAATGAASAAAATLVGGDANRLRSAERGRVLVYGATPAGIMAAIAAARQGAEVELLLGESPLGGMLSSGLSVADRGDDRVIGGLARRFYVDLGRYYGRPIAWHYEPHVAHKIFKAMLATYGVATRPGVLAKVLKDGATIRAIRTTAGTVLRAQVFVDASYEASLCSAAATTVYGRESQSTYGEPAAGYGLRVKAYEFEPSGAACRSMPGLTAQPTVRIGAADNRIMSFTYRLCVTADADRIPFSPPPGYDAERYAALTDPATDPFVFRLYHLPNGKFDVNGGGNLLDTDFVGGNVDFCTADRARRQQIAQAHADYQAGLLYFLATDTRVPAATREQAASLGLAPDEFTNTGNWPKQLYIREARRLVGDYVMRQSDITTDLTKADAIGMGSYKADSHAVQRFLGGRATVYAEGGIPPEFALVRPYQIPLRALLPKARQAANLLSAMPLSVSHVVWSSIRMEPQFMITGEAAGVAAALALSEDVPLSRIGGPDLTRILEGHGVVTQLAT
ncbi:MAG TPA: FAD-dependent oxidoreductase [Jatrophihabitans sp.]|nr:FAD-dependent oxidoreductase [Jatrophihabitans sp.]